MVRALGYIKEISGKLSKEARSALMQTSYRLIKITQYCIEELKFDYLLLGKIQTDPLENRFGSYRCLSGSLHNISVRQVYEAENKLCLQSFLSQIIKSAHFGNMPIELNNDNCISESESYSSFIEKIFVEENDISEVEDDLPLLTYIGEYCSYSVLKKLTFTFDKAMIIENDDSISWIKKFDRGSLLYPDPDVLIIIIYNYIIDKKLSSAEFEKISYL